MSVFIKPLQIYGFFLIEPNIIAFFNAGSKNSAENDTFTTLNDTFTIVNDTFAILNVQNNAVNQRFTLANATFSIVKAAFRIMKTVLIAISTFTKCKNRQQNVKVKQLLPNKS